MCIAIYNIAMCMTSMFVFTTKTIQGICFALLGYQTRKDINKPFQRVHEEELQ